MYRRNLLIGSGAGLMLGLTGLANAQMQSPVRHLLTAVEAAEDIWEGAAREVLGCATTNRPLCGSELGSLFGVFRVLAMADRLPRADLWRAMQLIASQTVSNGDMYRFWPMGAIGAYGSFSRGVGGLVVNSRATALRLKKALPLLEAATRVGIAEGLAGAVMTINGQASDEDLYRHIGSGIDSNIAKLKNLPWRRAVKPILSSDSDAVRAEKLAAYRAAKTVSPFFRAELDPLFDADEVRRFEGLRLG